MVDRQMGGWRDGCRCSKLWNVTNTREVNKKDSSLGLPEQAEFCPYLYSTLDETNFGMLMPREQNTNTF